MYLLSGGPIFPSAFGCGGFGVVLLGVLGFSWGLGLFLAFVFFLVLCVGWVGRLRSSFPPPQLFQTNPVSPFHFFPLLAFGAAFSLQS